MRAGRRRHHRLLIARGIDVDDRMREIIALAVSRSIPIERVEREQLDQRSSGHHQGVILEAGPYPYSRADDLGSLAAGGSLVLVLDGIEDPQNLGALLRTAEAAGVALVVIPADRAVGVTAAVVHASAGAAEHIRVAREVNLTRWLHRARDAGFWVAGLATDDRAEPLFAANLTPPIVLVVGSEGGGMRRLVRDACDILVTIPMRGQIDSLNASVAGAIAIYEVVRRS